MRKGLLLLIVLALVGFAVVSCVYEVITYCPFCGQAGIKEVSEYDPLTGRTEIYYECQNSKCQKTFGAGQIKSGS